MPRKPAPNKKAPAKRNPWRPSIYSAAKVDEICELLAQGIGLHVICAKAEMPGETTVYKWLETRLDFREKYAQARARAADRFASDVITIADDADETIRGVERARLRIDARKWAAGKFAPKKYGEKITQAITGADGGPVEVKATGPGALKNLTDEQLAQLESIAAAVAGPGGDKGRESTTASR